MTVTTANTCAECGRHFHLPTDHTAVPKGFTRVRLVRHANGKIEDWGTDAKTLAPSALVCDLCLNLPRHGEVVVTSENTMSFALAQMPRGDAVYGWPYCASRYLAPEFLFRKHLPKTWEALRQTLETQWRVEEKLNFWQRFLSLFRPKYRAE